MYRRFLTPEGQYEKYKERILCVCMFVWGGTVGTATLADDIIL